jgi:hypothetical protein
MDPPTLQHPQGWKEQAAMSMKEFEQKRFAEWIAKSRAHLDELERNPPAACPSCGHIPWPFTVTQHCWCDPADEYENE